MHAGERIFNAYVIPSKSISKGASATTRLAVIDGDLCLNDDKVNAVSAKTAVLNFTEYLQEFGCSIVLLAHNGFRFV